MTSPPARGRSGVVDRILRTADRTLHIPPLILITWGMVAVIINGVHQARESGLTVPPDQFFHVPLILAAIGLTVWPAAARRRSARRWSTAMPASRSASRSPCCES